MRYARMFAFRPRSLMVVLALKTIGRQLQKQHVAGAIGALTFGAFYAAWRYQRR